MMLEVISPHISCSSHSTSCCFHRKPEMSSWLNTFIFLCSQATSMVFIWSVFVAATMTRTQNSSSVLVRSKSLFTCSPEIMNIEANLEQAKGARARREDGQSFLCHVVCSHRLTCCPINVKMLWDTTQGSLNIEWCWWAEVKEMGQKSISRPHCLHHESFTIPWQIFPAKRHSSNPH